MDQKNKDKQISGADNNSSNSPTKKVDIKSIPTKILRYTEDDEKQDKSDGE